MHPGYCAIQHNPVMLNEKVQKIKQTLKSDKFKEVQGLVFIGKSGVFMAGALAMAGVQIPMVFVRKLSDESHGHRIENNDALDDLWYCPASLMFIDDLVDSGETLKQVDKAFEHELQACTKKWSVDHVLTFSDPFSNDKVSPDVEIAGKIRKYKVNV